MITPRSNDSDNDKPVALAILMNSPRTAVPIASNKLNCAIRELSFVERLEMERRLHSHVLEYGSADKQLKTKASNQEQDASQVDETDRNFQAGHGAR